MGADASPVRAGAAVALAESDGWLFTGRLSLQRHPWYADHMVGGVTVVPGTTFVELALRAGVEVGCEALQDLVFEAPLVLSEQGDVRRQRSGLMLPEQMAAWLDK